MAFGLLTLRTLLATVKNDTCLILRICLFRNFKLEFQRFTHGQLYVDGSLHLRFFVFALQNIERHGAIYRSLPTAVPFN